MSNARRFMIMILGMCASFGCLLPMIYPHAFFNAPVCWGASLAMVLGIGLTLRSMRRTGRELYDYDVELHEVCPHCGYDLRATPGRCPECGRETRFANEAAPRTPLPPDETGLDAPPDAPPDDKFAEGEQRQ